MTLGNKMELLASELVDRGLEVSNKDGQPLSAKAIKIKADKCDTRSVEAALSRKPTKRCVL